ncbi:hypothetical protein RJ639_047143 [Escallonia herrerae]|uniref:RRM domain-containing protein n=1 Tax=Escallonia herrerae TaxID=1293975 RepID=A0AA89B6M4_9ASTE|nr:hypothetical protein RJ639_047143 [Escallonia herrerae]
MGAKAKKSMMKKLKKGSTQLSAPSHKDEAKDFLVPIRFLFFDFCPIFSYFHIELLILTVVVVVCIVCVVKPLEGGPARKLPVSEKRENTAKVLYIGRISHGFYENEMEAFFKQFGTIKRLRIARNKKTGKSKHFGFIEFQSPEVTKIVADTMHNYLLFEHLLQVYPIPPEHVHPKLWKGVNRWYKPLNWVQIERKQHNKERTFEEHNKLVERIMKRAEKRRKRIEAAGIDYDCPEVVRFLFLELPDLFSCGMLQQLVLDFSNSFVQQKFAAWIAILQVCLKGESPCELDCDSRGIWSRGSSKLGKSVCEVEGRVVIALRDRSSQHGG